MGVGWGGRALGVAGRCLITSTTCLSCRVDVVRKLLPIKPRSEQVDRLRYSLVAMGLKYTICRVSLSAWVSLILVSAAPMMGSRFPLAEVIVSEALIRSLFSRPRCRMRWGPARQLWQPVSASAAGSLLPQGLVVLAVVCTIGGHLDGQRWLWW